jgi:hypothetical protein
MLHWKSHGLDIVELWFDEQVPTGFRPDIVRYHQALTPAVEGATDFFTLVTDLSQEVDALMTHLQKESRYEVRRAQEKDGLTLKIWNGDEAFLEAFVDSYREFAAQKGLMTLDSHHLSRLKAAGRLDISSAESADGEPLVYHAYYKHADRVRLLHSASRFRSSSDSGYRAMAGRANRWLHWQDLLRFKSEGRRWYDWGGWYEGKEDADRLRINQFKESFGGEVLHTYNGEAILSWKARLFVGIARLIGRR